MTTLAAPFPLTRTPKDTNNTQVLDPWEHGSGEGTGFCRPSGAGSRSRLNPRLTPVGYRLSVLRTSCPTGPGPAVRLPYTPNAANHPAAA